MAKTKQPKLAPLVIDPERVRPGDLARLLGISTQAVRKWVGAPRNRDGSYSMPDIWDWWKRVPGTGKAIGGEEGEAAMLALMSPEDRARLLRAKADHEEEKLQITRMTRQTQEGLLVHRAELETLMQKAAIPLRGFHEILLRAGSEYAKEYEAALEEALQVLGVEE